MTLAPRVCLLAHDASTKNGLGYTKIGKINIGNNVFVGAYSVILPNTKIGNNVVIGANSIVTKDIEENSVVAGNPAKFICTYDEYINKNKEKIKRTKCYDETYTLRNKKIDSKMKEKMFQELEGKIGYVE